MRRLWITFALLLFGCGPEPATMPDLSFERIIPIGDGFQVEADGRFNYVRGGEKSPGTVVGNDALRERVTEFLTQIAREPLELEIQVGSPVIAVQRYEGVEVAWCTSFLTVDALGVQRASGSVCRLTPHSGAERLTPTDSSALEVFNSWVAKYWNRAAEPEEFELVYAPDLVDDPNPVLHPQRRLRGTGLFVHPEVNSAWSMGSCGPALYGEAGEAERATWVVEP